MLTVARRSWWSWAVGLAVVGLAFGVWGVLGGPSALAQEGGGEPPDLGENIPGSVTIPFTDNISEDAIKAKLDALIGDDVAADIDKMEGLLVAKLEELAAAAEMDLPSYLEFLNTTVQELLDEAMEQIENAAADLKEQVDANVVDAAAAIKEKLDEVAPKVVVSGTYNNLTGWFDLEATTSGITQADASFDIGASFTVVLSPAGVGISIPVLLKVGADVDVTFTADAPVVATPGASTTDASAVPVEALYVSVNLKAESVLTISVEAGATLTTRYDRVHGTLVAGEEN